MKKYDIIYADPPWSYNQKVGQGIADDQYPTMQLEEIKSLPIQNLADQDCILLMWVTFPMLKEGLEVIKSWGFEYKTVALNWIKLNKNGQPFFGIGYYTKSNGEICLLATKDKPHKFVKTNKISQVILSVKGKHSTKPKEAYTKIEQLFGDLPRIELFARHKREGWDVWGLEAPSEIQMLLK